MATSQRKSTTFPAFRPVNPDLPSVQGTSPSRVSYQTEFGWASRQWEPGERHAYITQVLNRYPYPGERDA